MQILADDLTAPDIIALLQEHLDDMHRISPPESVHALDLNGLRRPEITFWCARLDGQLLGCGALKTLDTTHGEVKSMRTARAHLRRGVAATLLRHIIGTARDRGLRRLSLETGSQPEFAPAHRLYERHGFIRCGPFADYTEDPNSVFMTLTLQRESEGEKEGASR